MNTDTQRIEVFFDGIEGHTHTYGSAHSDCDLGGMGYGRSYQEAVDDALEFLADGPDQIDLGHNTETTDAVWSEVKRRAAELAIDITSEQEVEQMEAELVSDFVKREGMTAEQAEQAVLDCMQPVQLGIVIRFHGFLGDA
jgi:hypothetical protein